MIAYDAVAPKRADILTPFCVGFSAYNRCWRTNNEGAFYRVVERRLGLRHGVVKLAFAQDTLLPRGNS
jgi:hypothetical protein